jgi:hypothetical protein
MANTKKSVRPTKKKATGIVTPKPVPCECPDLCAGTLGVGFKTCVAGAEFVWDNYPATGGPWVPAVDVSGPTPALVWLNGAGL